MKYTMGKASWCFITEDRVVKCYGLRNKKTVKPARGSIFDCWYNAKHYKRDGSYK